MEDYIKKEIEKFVKTDHPWEKCFNHYYIGEGILVQDVTNSLTGNILKKGTKISNIIFKSINLNFRWFDEDGERRIGDVNLGLCNPIYDTIAVKDDNSRILKLLKDRLALGYSKYGHGMRINENTKKYGTSCNDWLSMELEELLDGIIYLTAATLRFQEKVRVVGRGDNSGDEKDFLPEEV